MRLNTPRHRGTLGLKLAFAGLVIAQGVLLTFVLAVIVHFVRKWW